MTAIDNEDPRQERGYRFETLAAKLFETQKFKVERSIQTAIGGEGRTITIDMLLTSPSGTRSVVEVKLYRTRAPNPLDVRRTCERLDAAQTSLQANNALLISNLPRSQMPNEQSVLNGVMLLGLDDLLVWARRDADLLNELTEFDRELNSALKDFDRPIERAPDAAKDAAPDEDAVVDHAEILRIKVQAPRATARVYQPSAPPKGYSLIQELKELGTFSTSSKKKIKLKSPPQREGAAWWLFEQICQDALIHVFDGVLDKWTSQKSVDGEDKRYDALAKVTGEDVFCRTLIEDFSTRYILFEFKNYKDPVPPNLIHITEKYLYPKALRATAVIISPKGLSDDAKAAARGALRENGRLMLELTVGQLCKLLDAKDNGTSGGAGMEELLDKFLLTLGR
ncbi:hypothetical protein [Caulobacter sp.]|uniref:hypothetical protein n=1 Tax=Caulobacter sp. TaxID=78 RepID=UPI001B25007F|nr:hypothetical protein [Caulobacter sp.]MBO9543355.1 hypothetical protein [Caulobacter sp.]